MKKSMDIYKIYAYIFLAIFIILFSVFGIVKVTQANTNNNEKYVRKVISEIKYLDINFVKLFNQMNNIEFDNYKISINEIDKKSLKDKKEDKSNEKNSSKSNEDEENEENRDIKIFDLKRINILTESKDINWQKIKDVVENMYLSIPTITLDLYQTKLDKKDILEFNSEYDNLTKFVQEENKEKTLDELVLLYSKMVKISENVFSKEFDKLILNTKLNLFKGYSKLDSKNWEKILKDIDRSIEEFSKILTIKDIEKQKIYSINKIYIMLNELKSSINIENTEIFLIKYKNIVEELNKM